MKKAILLLSLAFIGCTKPPKVRININGRWCFVEDERRCVDVLSIDDTTTRITFDKPIASPLSGPFSMSYKTDRRRDTTFCTTGFIYPPCFFTVESFKTVGYMAEWLYVPSRGTYKRLEKK